MAPVRVLWDEQEAAILLDYFIQCKAGMLTRMEAISKTSKELRERAKKNAILIDDVFRNENGIAMQMSKIEDLFIGRKGRLSKAPKVFENIVDQYRNDRAAFDKILREVREVSDDNLSLQEEPVYNTELNQYSENQMLSVSFGECESYAFTCPVSFSYFGDEYQVKNWTQLFVKIVCCLYEDYPDNIRNLIGKNIGGKGRIDIADEALANQMSAPKSLMDGLFLETNLSATDITLKIKQLLDLCGVDYENVVISYIATKLTNKRIDKANEVGIEQMSTTSLRVASSSDSKKFLHWMLDEQHMAPSSGRSYASGINNCEQMAIKIGLESTRLYGVSYDEAQKTVNMLIQTNEYQVANNSQHNRLRASITKYLQYLSGDNNVRFYQPLQINNAMTAEDLKPYATILKENFPKGYRADSTLDLKRFIRYYNGINGTELDVNDERVRSRTKQSILCIGVRHGEYVFAVDSLIEAETKEHLLSYIEHNFSQGKRAIYYRVIFEEFNEEFLGQRIYDEDMLRSYLIHECGNQYVFERSFMSQERNVQIDPKDEIRSLLISYGEPMKTEELHERLSNFPTDRIDWAIHTNKEFVCNTWGEYFHVSLIDLSDDELEEIAEIIQQTIAESHFVSGNELIHAIHKKYPSMLERFPQFSFIGIRDAIAYCLSDRFSFNGNIISSLQKQLSMSDVFAEFAKTHHSFTIDELNVLKTEMNSTIYFDSIYKNSLRVSQYQFVSKEEANFDVTATDKAIAAYCGEKYMPLAGVTSFGSFPYAGFPWSIYLLEHYVAAYSAKYKLLHTSFNADNCVGAIVKKNLGINNMNDLITDVLAHSDIQLNKKDALQYLCDMGYLARRRYSEIDQILIKARAKRG